MKSDQNPYATPESVEEIQRDEAIQRWSRRPFGVTIIAGMLLVRGVTSMGAAWFASLRYADSRASESFFVLAGQTAPVLFAFSIVGIITAIGGLRGRSWAWWLGIASGTARVTAIAGVLYFLYRDGHSMIVGMNLVRVTAISGAILYAFRESVWRYFGLNETRFRWCLLTAVVCGITIGVVVSRWMCGLID